MNGAAITGTITRGSKITFGGINYVNPQSRQDTGIAAQFTVTVDVAAGANSIPISPALTPSGQFQNVTASPANNASLTVLGAASSSWEARLRITGMRSRWRQDCRSCTAFRQGRDRRRAESPGASTCA